MLSLRTKSTKAFAELSQVAEAVNAGLVPITPAKVKCVPSNQTKVVDGQVLGNALWFEHALSRPLIYALCTGARSPQLSSLVGTYTFVGPRDADGVLALLLNLTRLNGWTSSFSWVNHFSLGCG
jgi:hypothetical protein